MNLAIAVLLGWIVMIGLMAALWWLQRRRGDAGIVDVAWGLGVGVLGAFFCAVAQGDVTRRALVAALILIWAGRLSLHIAGRLKRMAEDGRYQTLKDQWGPRAQAVLFGFFQLQAFWSVLFALPVLLAATNPSPAMQWTDWLGLAVWLIAFNGENIADRQLQRFRLDPRNKGQVCRQGLWYYSRHPNYFFEWIHWWAYAAFAIGAPWGFLGLLGPLVMLWFLLKVTGIPPTEAQALKSRGDAYRDYQRTTSVFLPWPPRSHGATR
ncbi:MAG: DUF1295 domain-containing protein [Planctomycetaceae bacterium]|nr:MAG: DUF1295 domain-containing protein [Planctomycetaceae bacterium]